MGIRGLSTFVDLNHQLLSEHKLHDTRIIIDGNNLYHFIWNHYRVSQQFGGDYDHFSRKCKLFFNSLSMCKIEPYVVFDGGYDPNDRKLPTILDRMKKRILAVRTMCRTGGGHVMPILAQETFRQVLVELGVPHVSCQFEADREIAVLANKWKCPVMSNDSDFFVFGLEGGFMPIDYINMTLCVFDSKTNKASVLDLGETLTEDQFVYIPVKMYKYERFVKSYSEDLKEEILPIFASILGNDYIDSRLLEGFYANLHVPKKTGQKFSVPKLNIRMLAVLKWLDSVRDLDKALDRVLVHLPREKRDYIRQQLINSVRGYKDLDEFIGLNLKDFLEAEDKSSVFYPELEDYLTDILPQWFVMGSRKCEISGQLQNIAVLHRVIRLCQVELLAEPSSYSCCSRKIMEVICGLVFKQSQGSTSEEETSVTTRDNVLVEYDRKFTNIKKVSVVPAKQIDGYPIMPSLYSLPELSQEQRCEFLCLSLGLPKVFIDKQLQKTTQKAATSLQNTMPFLQEQQATQTTMTSIVEQQKTQNTMTSLQEQPINQNTVTSLEMSRYSVLLVAVVCHWVKNAEPKVTQHHVYSLFMGILVLHVRCLNWLDQKRALGGNPVIPYMSEEIEAAYQDTTDKQRDKMLKHCEKFLQKLNHTVKNPRENELIHGFAQFQACLCETIHLNQLLMMPFEPPSPSLIFNSTLVYNMSRDFQTRVNLDLYVAEILGKNSPLHSIFLSWKLAVMEICDSTNFAISKWSLLSQGKSRSKSKKDKNKSKVKADINETGLVEDSGEIDGEQLLVNCDVSNKFAMLGLGE